MQPFSIFLGLGALTGLLLVGWRAPKKDAIRYLDAGLGILLTALVGSRIGAVVINWGYYQSHPGEIVQVWVVGVTRAGCMGIVGKPGTGPVNGCNTNLDSYLAVGKSRQAIATLRDERYHRTVRDIRRNIRPIIFTPRSTPHLARITSRSMGSDRIDDILRSDRGGIIGPLEIQERSLPRAEGCTSGRGIMKVNIALAQINTHL